MDHNSNPKPKVLKGSQSQRQPATRAAQFNKALQRTTVSALGVIHSFSSVVAVPLGRYAARFCSRDNLHGDE